MDEHQNVGSGVGSSDADVMQAPGETQGEAARVVDAVTAYPVVAAGAFARLGFGSGGVARTTLRRPSRTRRR